MRIAAPFTPTRPIGSDRPAKRREKTGNVAHAGKRKNVAPSIVDQRSGKLIIVHEGASRRLLVTACPASSRRLEGAFALYLTLSLSLFLSASLFDEFTPVDLL